MNLHIIKSYDMEIRPVKRRLYIKNNIVHAIKKNDSDEFESLLNNIDLSASEMGIDSEVIIMLLTYGTEKMVTLASYDKRFDFTNYMSKMDDFDIRYNDNIDIKNDIYDLRFLLQNTKSAWLRMTYLLQNQKYVEHKEFNFVLITSCANNVSRESLYVIESIIRHSDIVQDWSKIANYILKLSNNKKINNSRSIAIGYFLISPQFKHIIVKNYTLYDLEYIRRSFEIATTEPELIYNEIGKKYDIWPLVEIDRQIILKENKNLGTTEAIIPFKTYKKVLQDCSNDIKIQIIKGRFTNPNVINILTWKSKYHVKIPALQNDSLRDYYIEYIIVPFFHILQKIIVLKTLKHVDLKKLILHTSDPRKIEDELNKMFNIY